MNRVTRFTATALAALVVTAGGTASAFASEVGSHSHGTDDVAVFTSPAPTTPPAAATVTVDDRGTDVRMVASSAGSASRSTVRPVSTSKHKGRRTGTHRAVEHGLAHR